jgi:hypothetical protein
LLSVFWIASHYGSKFKDVFTSKSLVAKTEKAAAGHMRSKGIITLMACSNASGNFSLPLMCIGKSQRPRALKNIAPNVFPLYYKHKKVLGCPPIYKFGFTNNLFLELRNTWQPMVYLGRLYY